MASKHSVKIHKFGHIFHAVKSIFSQAAPFFLVTNSENLEVLGNLKVW